MTEPILLLSNIAAGSVRVLGFLFLTAGLLRARKPGGIPVIAALAGTAALTLLLSAAGLPEPYRIASEAVWFTICARLFQAADTRLSLFIGIFYGIALSFLQFLIAAWSGVIFRLSAFPDPSSAYGQAAVWLSHALSAIAVFYLWRHPLSEQKKTFRPAAALTTAGFIAVITLSQQTILPIEDDVLDLWTILAVILMMSVLVFQMNRQYETEKELARLKSEQTELLERDYTTLNHAYEINARLFHDFHNHIGVLRQLLSHEKHAEAIRYLDGLQAPVREMAETVRTGDEIVDYLINSKAAAAKAGGIQYQAQVEFPRRTNLRSADLCAVLGNFLDNALEAAGRVPKEEAPFIRLDIRRINQMLIIKVENSCAAPPVVENGALKTSKEQNGLHGWGLKSALTAAEKYDGTVRTSCSDGVFRAVASLSFQGV